MLKETLRLNYSILRNNLSNQAIQEGSLKISNKLLECAVWSLDYYHLFLSIKEKKEVDTAPILSILQGKDKQVVIPKIGANRELQHYLLTDHTVLKNSKWGIPEPVEGLEVPVSKIQVVFIPLLAFDERGHRVGYGKGFYDRFLRKCEPKVIKIGLSLFEAVPIIEDTDKHDIPLDYCVTPERIYSF